MLILTLLSKLKLRENSMSAKEQNFSFFGQDVLSKLVANEGKELMVFDWDRAATLIKIASEESSDVLAEAGLAGDWKYTGGVIYDNQIDDDSYTYLVSIWARPTLVLNGEEIECWLYKDDATFDSGTKWPQSARDILDGEIK
jgi:hypothetical protein